MASNIINLPFIYNYINKLLILLQQYFNKLTKKHQEECLESLASNILENDYVIDGELISDITNETLEYYEELEKEEKKKRKKKKDKKIRKIKVRRIKD